MARTLKQIDAWINAHVKDHVHSGHSHPTDATDADVGALDARVDVLEEQHAATPPPLVEPPPPPPPPPPTNGIDVPAGKFASAIAAATSGQTLLVASQDIPGATYLTASGVTVAGKTSPAIIRPVARPNGLFVKGSRNVVRNLDFVGAPSSPGQYNDSMGSALLEILGEGTRVTDTLIEDVGFDLPAGAGSRQHGAYVAYDVERLTMRRIKAIGHASQGGRADALTGWHPGGAPSKDIVFEDWVFTDFYNAVVFWLSCTSLTFRRCTFIGTLNSDIQVDTGGPVYLEGCRGRKGVIATSGYSGAGMTVVVDRGGNDWSWTP